MGKASKRKQIGRKPKGKDKNTWSPKTKQRRRLLAKKEIIDARLAALDQEDPEPEPEDDAEQSTRDDYENRVVVKFFWKQLGSPTDPEEWKQRGSLGLRYDDGTPRQLSWAMRRTWLHNPSSERIVEDISRYPTVIDRVVEHKGGVVPDHKLRAGCSQRKRKLTEPSRCYVMSPQVATVARDRSKQLREIAQKMCGNA